MDGVIENWVLRLATTLKTSLIDVNVVITDWLTLAHQHYPIAVQSTRTVGKDIAHLLQSLQVRGKVSTCYFQSQYHELNEVKSDQLVHFNNKEAA